MAWLKTKRDGPPGPDDGLTSSPARQRPGGSSNRAHLAAQAYRLGGSAGAVQRAIDVELKLDNTDKKGIVAVGKVRDFTGGSSAGNQGWVGVTSYQADYTITDTRGNKKYQFKSRSLKNGFTTPERGHVLAKQNGGNGADAENVFGQDGGSNNGPYKAFEGKMRSDLDNSKPSHNVLFRSYLGGTNIRKGWIEDEAESSADEISSDDDMPEFP